MTSHLLNAGEAAERVGISPTELLARAQAGRAPLPLRLGAALLVWRLTDLEHWLSLAQAS